MSSPTVSIFQPGSAGVNIARLVFPQALGNAAAIYFFSPSGLVIPKMSICSANHPSSFPIFDAILNAKHFFPSRALPPYPLPYDQIDRSSGKWTIHRLAGLQGQGTSFSPAFNGDP